MEELMKQLQPAIMNLAVVVITTVFSYIGFKIKTLYQEKVNTETKRLVAKDTVRYIEQVYYDIDGEEKMQKALNIAVDSLSSQGIAINQQEIKMLLESAVNALKGGFSR